MSVAVNFSFFHTESSIEMKLREITIIEIVVILSVQFRKIFRKDCVHVRIFAIMMSLESRAYDYHKT